MSNSEIILKARSLSKRFGGLKAVDDGSFEVTRLGVTSMIGPNGAGGSSDLIRKRVTLFRWPRFRDGKDAHTQIESSLVDLQFTITLYTVHGDVCWIRITVRRS